MRPPPRDRDGGRRGRWETARGRPTRFGPRQAPASSDRGGGDEIVARLERLESVVMAIAAHLGIDAGRPARQAGVPEVRGAPRGGGRRGDADHAAGSDDAHAVVRTVARRLSGRIKQYQPPRGYGFVTTPDTPGDVFFHRSDCRVDPATLEPSAAVIFDLVEMANGQFKAVNLAPPK